MNKQAKGQMLNYLLLDRSGEIFDDLLVHLSHHSLSQLLIELLQVQVEQGA